MNEKTKAIVFFDSDCSFCRAMIAQLLKIDKNKILLFAALSSNAAKEMLSNELSNYQTLNTLVLYLQTGEKKEIFLYAKAVFRILFEIGGVYKLIGWKYKLPSFLIDPFYKFFAKHRSRFKLKKELDMTDPRFLP